jgi:hypothetical protein
VATAVEARKLLRLGPEEPEEPERPDEGEAAFGVIASTLRGAPGHPAVAVGSGVMSGTGQLELANSTVEALRCRW